MKDFENEGKRREEEAKAKFIGKEVVITRGKFKGRTGYISSLCSSYPFTPPFINAHVEVYFKDGSKRTILDYAYNQHWHTLDTLQFIFPRQGEKS